MLPPLPVADFGHVKAVLVYILPVFGKFVFKQVFEFGAVGA